MKGMSKKDSFWSAVVGLAMLATVLFSNPDLVSIFISILKSEARVAKNLKKLREDVETTPKPIAKAVAKVVAKEAERAAKQAEALVKKVEPAKVSGVGVDSAAAAKAEELLSVAETLLASVQLLRGQIEAEPEDRSALESYLSGVLKGVEEALVFTLKAYEVAKELYDILKATGLIGGAGAASAEMELAALGAAL